MLPLQQIEECADWDHLTWAGLAAKYDFGHPAKGVVKDAHSKLR